MTMGRVRVVDLLAILFGIGTWVCVNGLWVELPLLVQRLPEGWNLPSYMAVVIQLANLGPLTYTFLNSFYPKIFSEKRCIYSTLIVGALATVFLSIFWNETVYLFGSSRSVPLLVLVFCLAFVDCSSRVLFLPFMAQFQEIYLTSFFIGEGLSGVLPSLFALVQGVGGNPECRNVSIPVANGSEPEFKIEAINPDPRFQIEAFFLILTATMICSTIGFYFLNLPKFVKKAYANPNERGNLFASGQNSQNFYQSTSETSLSEIRPDPNENTQENPIKISLPKSHEGGENDSFFKNVKKSTFIYLMVIQALVCCFANGVFPSIQSYSCLPYGNVPYHLAVTLSTIANPIVCFMAFYLPQPDSKSITSIGVLAFVVASYVLTTAIQSPNPPFVGDFSGEILLICSWILLSGLFTYVKISVATIARSEGKRGLFWCGAITQIGSFVGALTTFFIVNFTDVFESFYPC